MTALFSQALKSTQFKTSHKIFKVSILLGEFWQWGWAFVPVNSKTAILPRAIPRHLTHVKLCTVRNLNQNEARPVGHLTFASKCLSGVGNKRILQFFDSACEQRSQVMHCSCWFHVGFSVVVGRQAEQEIRNGWKLCRTCFQR